MEALTLIFDTKYGREVSITVDEEADVEVEVDWGNGEKIQYLKGKINYTYSNNNIYTVKITGKARWVSLENNKSLIRCTSFGNLGVTSFSSMFRECINLIQVPEQIPSIVTNTSGMFLNAEFFNSDISSWNVSNVTDMSYMFDNALSFNSDISSWNVSNVTDMNYMFFGSGSFNQSLNSWDVSNVTDMSSMFYHARSFNQELGSWNVGNVINMSFMLCYAVSFNSDISSWNVGNVSDMSYMFHNTKSFNSDIGAWSLKERGNVTNMIYMFNNATSLKEIPSWYKKR